MSQFRHRADRYDEDDVRRDDLWTLFIVFFVLALAFWCATDERASSVDSSTTPTPPHLEYEFAQ